MGNAEVKVFAPGDLTTPVQTGRADPIGKFEYQPSREGLWVARARSEGEVMQITTRVGGAGQQPQQQRRISPLLTTVGLVGLLALAGWYRLLRIRNQNRSR